MVRFFKSLVDRLFGPEEEGEQLPDDGGLAEFAKQFAKQLEREEKFGAGPMVSADSVLSVQQGRHGSKSYLLDTSDFKRAIMAELRDSVAPVTEGILKTRCGEKGTGFMCVKSLYIFHVYHKDPVSEYNAAMDIIDDIGERLLGDRYITGERRINVPVAQIEPDELFESDGSFNLVKAKKTIKFVRDAKTHGPVNVDWEKGEVKSAQGSGDWVEEHHKKEDQPVKEWQAQTHQPQEKVQGEWQKMERSRGLEETSRQAPVVKPVKQEVATEVAWGDFGAGKKTEVKKSALVKEVPVKPANEGVKSSPVGTLSLVFRPSWDRQKHAINSYVGCGYRKDLRGQISFGERIFDDLPTSLILEIDETLAHQAARHLQSLNPSNDKVIILPIHLESLLAPKRDSPIKAIRQLSSELRNIIWIEIIGLRSNTSPQKIQQAVSAHRHKFKVFGLRCDLSDLSRSLVDRSGVQFLSCDVQAGTTSGLQTRKIQQDLTDLQALAKDHNMAFYAWGLRDQKDLQTALRAGAGLINGRALAKEVRRPDKVIALSPEKLVAP